MKTHVLMLSPTFPKGHIREGEPTDFKNKVGKDKLHTMREPGKWAQRIKDVQEGNSNAVLSMREWTGKAYNSLQKELFRFNAFSGIGFEYALKYTDQSFQIRDTDNDKMKVIHISELAKNDGLSLPDFQSWFRNVEEGTELIIIHFTPFRYL